MAGVWRLGLAGLLVLFVLSFLGVDSAALGIAVLLIAVTWIVRDYARIYKSYAKQNDGGNDDSMQNMY